jgi:chromosome segregation ATPase
MGDSAEFEKLTALETRLAAALDRIAKGLAAQGVAVGDAGASAALRAQVEAAETARAEAEARAGDLAARVAALEGRLGDAQEALAAAEAHASRMATLEDSLAARDARIAEMTAAQAELEARIAGLETSAVETGGDAARLEELEHEAGILRRRVERARQERDEMRAARDAAQDLADELSEGSGAEPEPRILALRGEVRRLQSVIDDMSQGLDTLRAAASGGGDGVDSVLAAQVAALTEARRAEAAELGRILADLGANGTARQEADHA